MLIYVLRLIIDYLLYTRLLYSRHTFLTLKSENIKNAKIYCRIMLSYTKKM